METLIARQGYIELIEKRLSTGLIVVLTGQRRVGKSYLLCSFRDKKLREERGSNVIYVDLELRENDNIRTHIDLNAYIEAHYRKGQRNYILLDEVQNVAEFERSLRSWCKEPDTFVVVTGSNAHMLSTELTTYIGGRYTQIYVQPLSYEEFLTFHKETDSQEALQRYIEIGGMPGLPRVGNNWEDVRTFLSDINTTALFKDVVLRNGIRNVAFLERLVLFLADNTGKLISANSISKCMKGLGESVTPTAVISYLQALCDAYIVHRVSRYDIHGRRLFDTNAKYYFEDHGLRNALVGKTKSTDMEKVLENIVYQHLRRLHYEVTVGQLQNGEVDFVCTHADGSRVYVQVTLYLFSQETYNREYGNLRAIGDEYPKFVISLDPGPERTVDEGIVRLSLHRFLTEGLKTL